MSNKVAKRDICIMTGKRKNVSCDRRVALRPKLAEYVTVGTSKPSVNSRHYTLSKRSLVMVGNSSQPSKLSQILSLPRPTYGVNTASIALLWLAVLQSCANLQPMDEPPSLAKIPATTIFMISFQRTIVQHMHCPLNLALVVGKFDVI